MFQEVSHRDFQILTEKRQTELFTEALFMTEDFDLHKQDPPEPDFGLEIQHQIIGIEHTWLSYNDNPNSENRNQISAIQRGIVNEAEKFMDNILPEKGVSVNISIDYEKLNMWLLEGNKLRKSDKEQIGKKVVDLVKLNLPEMEQLLFLEEDSLADNDALPFPVSCLGIFRGSFDFDTHFGASGGYKILGINKQLVSSALEQKESKVLNYKKSYDQVWLLMVVNKFRYEFDIHLHNKDEIENILFRTSLNRAFVFESSTKEIVELKIDNVN